MRGRGLNGSALRVWCTSDLLAASRRRHAVTEIPGLTMLDIKSSADYLSRSGTFPNFSMLFAGEYFFVFTVIL